MNEKLDIVLHSDFSPAACLAKLGAEIDADQLTLFSLSGYRGNRPILGRIVENEFRLHKRRYWHNAFGPVLFGRILPGPSGALIEDYWSMWKVALVYRKIWLGFAVVIGVPVFLQSLLGHCAKEY
jgi:hypothetical protein